LFLEPPSKLREKNHQNQNKPQEKLGGPEEIITEARGKTARYRNLVAKLGDVLMKRKRGKRRFLFILCH